MCFHVMHKIFILTFLIIGNKLEVAAAAPAWCYCVGAMCGASVAATKNLKTCAAAALARSYYI